MADEVVRVNLAPFWSAVRDIEQEQEQERSAKMYTTAATFWGSFDAKLSTSYDNLRLNLIDLQSQSGWNGAAATAFYERMDAGLRSIQNWRIGGTTLLDGGTETADVGTAAVRTEFGRLVTQLAEASRLVVDLRTQLLAQDKVTGSELVTAPRLGLTRSTLAKITEQDQGWVEVRESDAGAVNDMVNNAVRLRDDLRRQFDRTTLLLNTLPDNEKWQGPTTLAEQTPPGRTPPGPAGPGAGPPGGGPAGGPGGAPGGSPAGGPGDTPAGGPGTTPAGGPAGSDPSTTPGSTTDPGAQTQGTDQIAADSSVPELPPTDPELAGTPTSTTTPTSTLPGSTTSPSSSTVPGGPSSSIGGPSSTGSSVPLTSMGGVPLTSQGSSPTRRDGVDPNPSTRSSTVDGQRGPATAGSPVPGGGSSGTSARGGPGFMPPMMPMYPPGMGGGMGNGAKPGEAEFANGPMRKVGGPEAWRAGLRPQLLGRAGDRDDESHLPESLPLPDNEALDEELWQVSDIAPVAPPEQQSRRDRLWGPG